MFIFTANITIMIIKKRTFVLFFILTSICFASCKEDEDIVIVEKEDLYPTLIEGKIGDESYLIEDKHQVHVNITTYFYTLPREITAEELVYYLVIDLADDTTMYLNLSHPLIMGKKYHIDKSPNERTSLKDNHIYIRKGNVSYVPKENNFIEGVVNSAILYNREKVGYYIDLTLNGELFDYYGVQKPIMIDNLHIKFYSQVFGKY